MGPTAMQRFLTCVYKLIILCSIIVFFIVFNQITNARHLCTWVCVMLLRNGFSNHDNSVVYVLRCMLLGLGLSTPQSPGDSSKGRLFVWWVCYGVASGGYWTDSHHKPHYGLHYTNVPVCIIFVYMYCNHVYVYLQVSKIRVSVSG